MLHIAIIILILVTFPTVPSTVSAVSPTLSQTINRSHLSTYDFYRCGYTNLGILFSLSLNLSIFNLCTLFKRCPSHHVSPQYLLNFSCCLLSKYYHLLPLLLFLLRLAFIFPTFPSLLSFFLSLFLLYNDLQAILQFTVLRLLLLMLVSFIPLTPGSSVHSIATI